MRYFRLADKLAGANRTNCSIILERSLDFEVQTVHILRILALNAYVDSRFDTRNVVEVIINIFVMDIQDTAPIFVSAPPITSISDKMESVIKLPFLAYNWNKHNKNEFLPPGQSSS